VNPDADSGFLNWGISRSVCKPLGCLVYLPETARLNFSVLTGPLIGLRHMSVGTRARSPIRAIIVESVLRNAETSARTKSCMMAQSRLPAGWITVSNSSPNWGI
jgi:hypothetical protein